MKTENILICADFEVPIDPVTHICPQCLIVHDMQSTYLWSASKPLPVRKKRVLVRKKRVLVVDDDGDIRRAIADYFRMHGFDVVEAVDGRIGVEQWRESYPVDYLVTDYQMPKKNGVVMCMEICAMMERWKAELPIKTSIVMLSADPPKLPKEIADIPVLQKPVRMDVLLEKLGIE